MKTKPEKITIIGAGLTGPLLALYLGKKGFNVHLYERRPDIRKENISAGRSINLAISHRGLSALAEVGLRETVLKDAIPMPGRMIHHLDQHLVFQPYGRHEKECIYAISRAQLNKILLDAAESMPNIRMSFHTKATHMDFEKQEVSLFHDETKKKWQEPFAHLIGCDGLPSEVRKAVVEENRRRQHPEAYEHIEELADAYKELHIPPAKQQGSRTPYGLFQMEPKALHIWPRKSFMLIALPNQDGSFTCTLFLTKKKKLHQPNPQYSFEELDSEKKVFDFFQEQFPDALPLMPTLLEDFFHNPTGHLSTLKCYPWHVEDKALLLGDAAHAIVPFYGQGMNCCFEDCSTLAQILNKNEKSEKSEKSGPHFLHQVFSELEKKRKINTDAIADMARDHFIEMRDLTADPRFIFKKEIEQLLMRKYPDQYLSIYNLVTFSSTPYAFIHECERLQQNLLESLSQGKNSLAELKEEEIEKSMAYFFQQMSQLKKSF